MKQRNFAAHHCIALSFYFSSRPPVYFVDHELTGAKEIKEASLTVALLRLQSIAVDVDTLSDGLDIQEDLVQQRCDNDVR